MLVSTVPMKTSITKEIWVLIDHVSYRPDPVSQGSGGQRWLFPPFQRRNMDGKGLLFVGHSDAGKSTTVTLLKDQAEILCDDRIIVRKKPEGFKIYGTWSHGDVPDVSAASAPCRRSSFLKQSPDNRIVPVEDTKESLQILLACLIKPYVEFGLVEKSLTFIEALVQGVPCYNMYFDKTDRSSIPFDLCDPCERKPIRRQKNRAMNLLSGKEGVRL